MARVNRRTRLLFFLLAFSFAVAASPAFASPPGAESRPNPHLPDEMPRLFALLPDGKISLPGSLCMLSARASMDLIGKATDGKLAEKELDRLARNVLARTGGLKDPARTVSALNRVLFEDEEFTYDPAPGNPESFLLDRVLARKRGNCLGLSAVYLSLAERLEIPLGGVYVPSHCFVRFEGNGARINVETGEEGVEHNDGWYSGKYRLKEGSPYLQTLGKREMIGVYLKNIGAAYSRKGREKEALRRYREASLCYPDLPDVHYNAGVSLQRMGNREEAIARYRKALALDPYMVAARGNLATAYCGSGKMEDGIREFRKALEINPNYALVRAGLARAYFTRGAYREAIEQCDRAMEQGWRFEPSMLEVLNRYRSQLP